MENDTIYKQNSDGGTLEIEVTDYMRDVWKNEMGFEVQMMQGEYKQLPGGLHYYKFNVPPEKVKIVKIFFRFLVENPNIDGSIKIMSYPINNN